MGSLLLVYMPRTFIPPRFFLCAHFSLFEIYPLQVCAAWWPVGGERKRSNIYSWYPRRITSVKEVDKGSAYGPVHYYSIGYDDGDKLAHVREVMYSPSLITS